MKKSRLCSWLLLGLFILFLHYHVLDAFSNQDQKSIQLATSAVRSMSKAMKAVKFISWISTVGSALGPAMLAVSAILNIVLSFIGIESPEMKLMKKEFSNLNNRLDSFSEKFEDVKRKIDWSSINLSYGSVESSIRSMSVYFQKISSAKSSDDRYAAIQLFLDKFEISNTIASEELYNAIVAHQSLSDSLFEASGRYTNQHPEKTAEFMKGCIQLLIQSYEIQAAYFHLKHNNSKVDEYFSRKVSKQMDDVVEKSKEIYITMTKKYREQSLTDLKRISLNNLNLSHQQFARMFYQYLTEKFIDRRWIIIAYKPVSTYNKHAVWHKDGVHLTLHAGRNYLVASIPADGIRPWNFQPAVQILQSFPHEIVHNDDPALEVLNKMTAENTKSGSPLAAIAVLKLSVDYGYELFDNRALLGAKVVRWCNDPACWGTGTRTYHIIMFG